MNNDISSNNNSYTLLISGDFCPINRVEKLIMDREYELIFKKIKPLIASSHYFITNLECALTQSTDKIIKSGPHIKSDPQCVHALTYCGINMVTLANNHIMDYGERGLNDTIETCNIHDIEVVGAGKNLDEAAKIKLFNVEDVKISVLNYAEHEFSIATENKAGANPINLFTIHRDLKNAKLCSDIVVVILHAGNEGYDLPRPGLQKMCRYLAEIGADLIACHHTHTISGFEVYNQVPIFYGLGNFVFDWPGETDENWFIGSILSISFNKDGINEYKLVPFKQCKEKPEINLLEGKEYVLFNERIEKLSLIIKDSSKLANEWNNFIANREWDYLIRLLGFNKWTDSLLRRNLFRNYFLKSKDLKALINLFQCDSHREAITDILKEKL